MKIELCKFGFSNNGQLWYPKPHSVICSEHFVGNKRSNDSNSPSYIPSLFPEVYKKKQVNIKQLSDRYIRTSNRQDKKLKMMINDDKSSEVEIIEPLQCESLNCVSNVGIQVMFDFNNTNPFKFECEFNKLNNDVGTQANIPLLNNISKISNTKDIACGPNVSCLNMNSFLGYHSITNESQLKDLTSTTFKVFNLPLSFISDSCYSTVSKENRLMIFLIKIKLGISYSAIGVLFNINRTTVSRIFYSVLNSLVSKTKHFIFWPNKKSILDTLPRAFKQNYPNCRCIIDCTEIKTEQPSTVEQRVNMYSRYKNAYTVKTLVAITPSGLISFLSKCYGGRASDTFITNDCGFLSKLEKGDEVLADKGFPGIKVSCKNKNSILIMPPFLHNGRFSENEVVETYNIASVRIHIERVFAKLKTLGILNKITIDLLPQVDDIMHICCVLINLQNPIIKD